ncbi:iron-containing alcohol dehydrogenase family protein [Yersinia rochesterensis]|uniref:Glycerol dehydrogenase n=1 Tax=Yersinia rochesterensis TaxID=1604335 RepID=A0A386HAN7_9GAMM|nr:MULTISPECIES: glycerol dehydrogenase [Yersinia]AJI88049.1 glycerol dehydrogenase [Yersinia frederiksenii Y225]CNH15889.1 glycerol dehydrogenase [Yersinia kristensenii]AIN17533.1 glycerol dehydrogenase [Yersinia rochesterensis]AJJ34924.1 iron-containing alcohol dehydrogenase family protein [Yersinia rochesterensis]AYD42832.1 glycerol dehydrogenase [Yersinia rochesterensis]
MLKVIQSPSKYIQGANALQSIGQFAKLLANNYFIIADDFVMKLTADAVGTSLQASELENHFSRFNGECSRHEIERLTVELKKHHCNGVIGIGGGKTLDTAKAIAHYQHIPVIVVPTIASTDAPTSALSVIYTEQGEFAEYLIYPKNPDIVLMDTAIIAKAPVRLLVAGMGDALSTYFEAQACFDAKAISMAGGASTLAAVTLARLCYETLLAEGYKAKLAVEAGVVTEAVERIIEANTYLSGIGFESSGLAAAHAIHNGFTVLEECHHLYHGEKVAFGTLAQLVLQNSSMEEIETVLSFCQQLGLPITLAEMGVSQDIEHKIRAVAEASCAEGETIHNMPFAVTADSVYAAIIVADRLGQAFLD